eukprot:TRINITY_DN454_c0_g1_i1.p2 TRINITY_DN454_c0_g1~~TRINITY_DN454_c0_g1_i1.p2  ORF type:complete len:803 (-),score=205.32 TRINITY_DN454_c0_g1_i1:118-2526(-)
MRALSHVGAACESTCAPDLRAACVAVHYAPPCAPPHSLNSHPLALESALLPLSAPLAALSPFLPPLPPPAPLSLLCAMRSKQKKQPSSNHAIPPDDELPFQLGDLVLCRYSTYPYWPATVDQTHQAQRSGQHVCMHETRDRQRVLAFWCTFSAEDTGGWVRADRMVHFHPSLLDYVRVRRNHHLHEPQSAAIEAALNAFRAIHEGSTEPPKPDPPNDMLKRNRNPTDTDLVSDDDEPDDNIVNDDQAIRENDPMDIGTDSSDDEHRFNKTHSATRARRPTTSAKSPRTVSVPKTKRRKRKSAAAAAAAATAPRVVPTPRKRAKTAEQQLEDQLLNQSESKQVATLTSTIEEMRANLEKLTASLRRKEKALSDLRASGNVVTFAPVKQDTVPIESIPKPFTGSLLSSDEFEHRVKTMRQLFEKLDNAAKDVHEKRQQLAAEQEKIRQHYSSLLDGVSSAQGDVVTHQKQLADLLRGILVSRVAVVDLRKHQAGNLIKTMSKRYKDMPNVWAYCNALYRGWKRQVVDYVHNNPGIKDEEKKDKSPRADSKENGGVATPSASQESSLKGDDAPKRSKRGAGNGDAAKASGDANDGEGNDDGDAVKTESREGDEMDVDKATDGTKVNAKDGVDASAKKDVKGERESAESKEDADGAPKVAGKKGKGEAQVLKETKDEKEQSADKGRETEKSTSKQSPTSDAKKLADQRESDKDAQKAEGKEKSAGKQAKVKVEEKATAKGVKAGNEGEDEVKDAASKEAVEESEKGASAKGDEASQDGVKRKNGGARGSEAKKGVAKKGERAKADE